MTPITPSGDSSGGKAHVRTAVYGSSGKGPDVIVMEVPPFKTGWKRFQFLQPLRLQQDVQILGMQRPHHRILAAQFFLRHQLR